MRPQAPLRPNQQAAPHSGPTRRLVRCTAGGDTYCIDNEWLDSIHVVENLYPRKGSDGSIGWIRRFDEKVPVYRLTDQLERPVRATQQHGVILVIEKNERAWALLVDKVSAAAEVPAERVFPMPGVMGDSACTRFPNVVIDNGELTLYLAPDYIVPREVSGAPVPQQRGPAPVTTPHPLRRVASAPAASRSAAPAASSNAPAAVPAASAASSARTAARQIVTFTLAHRERTPYPIRFAVSAGQALEIVGDLPMISVPESPFFVQSLASWRALPVPVMDLGAWLGLPPAPYKPGSRVLICRATQTASRGDGGLIAISGVEDIRKLDLPIQCTPWSEDLAWNASLALGVYLADRGMLVVPDLDAVFRFQAPSTGSYRM